MIDRTLHKLIKNLDIKKDDYEVSMALLRLMDYCNVNNLHSVRQEDAEIFYILYNNIIYNPLTLTDIKIKKV